MEQSISYLAALSHLFFWFSPTYVTEENKQTHWHNEKQPMASQTVLLNHCSGAEEVSLQNKKIKLQFLS